jgi:hypothetical protein
MISSKPTPNKWRLITEIQWNLGSWIYFVPGSRSSPKMFVNRNYCVYFVLSESYTATDVLLPILPACHQLLLPACVFVTQDTVHHLKLFWWGKFVCDKRRLWTEVPLYIESKLCILLVLITQTANSVSNLTEFYNPVTNMWAIIC